MKHIIVTGAYGLIGSNFCKTIPSDWQVTKIKGMEVPPFTEMADYIVHGAGYGQPIKFLEDEMATIEINTEMTANLFKFYLKPGGSFLYLSTSEVYSGLQFPPFKESEIGTTTPEHPRACYIESKRCGETICMAQRRLGIDAKVARLSLVYGEGVKKGDTRVVSQFIEQALTNKKIDLLDQGNAKRTYCYVSDAVKILWKILLEGRKPIYNVGGFSTITIYELAKTIGSILNVPVNIPKGNGKHGLVGAPKNVRLDMDRVLNEFDMQFQDFVELKDGLKKTIAWQKSL